LGRPVFLAQGLGIEVEDDMVLRAMKRFAQGEGGAVTVDWVVLTAAIIALVFSVFGIITQQSVTVGAEVMNDNLENAAVYSPGFGTWVR
jgi:hypothetical protein